MAIDTAGVQQRRGCWAVRSSPLLGPYTYPSSQIPFLAFNVFITLHRCSLISIFVLPTAFTSYVGSVAPTMFHTVAETCRTCCKIVDARLALRAAPLHSASSRAVQPTLHRPRGWYDRAITRTPRVRLHRHGQVPGVPSFKLQASGLKNRRVSIGSS